MIDTRVARHVGKMPDGSKVLSVPVTVSLNNSRTLASELHRFRVLARSVTEAANHVRDAYQFRPETEVFAYGPRGGEVYRYVGWETAMGNEMVFGSEEAHEAAALVQQTLLEG